MRYQALLLVLALASGTAIGALRWRERSGIASPATTAVAAVNPAIAVDVYTVAPEAFEVQVPATGTLLARESVEIVSELARRLLKVRAEEGRFVRAGDVLFELDSADLRAELNKAAVQERLARATLERTQKLATEGVSNQQELDVARGKADELEAERQLLEVTLSKTQIRAPFSGRLGLRRVSEGAARRLWPGRDPIGQRLSEPSYRTVPPVSPPPWQTVVGVVTDVRYRGLNDVRLDMYLPATQSGNKVESLMIRTDGVAANLVDGVRAAAREIDPRAQVSGATMMRTVVDGESAPWRFLMRVFLAFAGLAATLAAVGVAAVVVMTVALRRREPGQCRLAVLEHLIRVDVLAVAVEIRAPAHGGCRAGRQREANNRSGGHCLPRCRSPCRCSLSHVPYLDECKAGASAHAIRRRPKL